MFNLINMIARSFGFKLVKVATFTTAGTTWVRPSSMKTITVEYTPGVGVRGGGGGCHA